VLRRFTQQKVNNIDSRTAAAGCNAPDGLWQITLSPREKNPLPAMRLFVEIF